ncbi:MAG: hypothetical protein HYZ37_17420 [Candidatus Solibacter usitatus]|nr:hypothetical protein [Candidatus Solibacter usitatus]
MSIGDDSIFRNRLFNKTFCGYYVSNQMRHTRRSPGRRMLEIFVCAILFLVFEALVIVALFGGVEAAKWLAMIVGPRMPELSRAQWFYFSAGVFVAATGGLAAYISARNEFLGDEPGFWRRQSACILAAVFVFGLYTMGCYKAHGIALNRGASDKDSAIRSVFSWVYVTGEFGRHLYEKRNEPLDAAVNEFSKLTDIPETAAELAQVTIR